MVARAEGVGAGLAPTVATGTRLIDIAAGDAYAAGVLAESDSAVQVALDANSSGQSRIDVVCLKLDWSGTETTAGTFVALKGAPGATPQLPTIPRTAGGVWHIPLAQVLVRNGVGQISTTDLLDVRPGMWLPYTPYWGVSNGLQLVVGNGSHTGQFIRLPGGIIEWHQQLTRGSSTNVGTANTQYYFKTPTLPLNRQQVWGVSKLFRGAAQQEFQLSPSVIADDTFVLIDSAVPGRRVGPSSFSSWDVGDTFTVSGRYREAV